MPIDGQIVRGRLVEEDTGTPVEGALIQLVDLAGAVFARTLTSTGGSFLLRAPAPGLYRVLAQRIGHADSRSTPFTAAAADTVRLELRAPVRAVSLTGIDVDGDRRCTVRPEEGLAVSRVWDEARKALESARWLAEHGAYEYEIVRFDRRLERDARRVVREELRHLRTARQTTFVSLPAEELQERGYVQERDGDTYFYAPDAEVLLSDAFLDTHCFRLRRGDDEAEGLLGLEFEPVHDRDLPDVRGTLWVDPETSQLQWLEYGYWNLRLGIDTRRLGGRVEFQALPSGPWVVRHWAIRMPVLAAESGSRSGRRLEAIHEVGADVTLIVDHHGDTLVGSAGGTVAGSVVHAADGSPVAGALVRLVGTPRSSRARQDGTFAIGGLPDGRYSVAFRTAVLDSLGHDPEPVEVSVERGGVARVTLQAPDVWDLLSEWCSDSGGIPEGTAAVAGRLRGSGADAEVDARGPLRFQWSTFAVRNQGLLRTRRVLTPRAPGGRAIVRQRSFVIDEEREAIEVTPDGRGVYVACGVPTDVPLSIIAPGAEPLGLTLPTDQRTLLLDVVVP